MPKKKKEEDTMGEVAEVVVKAPVVKPTPKVIKMSVYDFATSYAQRRTKVEAAGAFIVLCEQEKCTVATKEEFEEKFQAFLAAPAR